MNKFIPGLLVGGLLSATLAIAEDQAAVHPAEMSKEDIAGEIFERDATNRTERNGFTVLDVTSLKSSDGKFASGMYKAGKSASRSPNLTASMSSCISWKAASRSLPPTAQ
jgi:hypothetical protein